MFNLTVFSRANWNKATLRTRLASFVQILFALVFLTSQLGMSLTRAAAAPAGTALSFNGTASQYVTFGDTAMTRGALIASPTWNTNLNSKLGASSLTFNGSTQYVTFGNAAELGLTNFTIETWFFRTGAGVGTDTSGVGGGGLQGAIPLVTKGRGEGDYSNLDMNYFLGISSTNFIAADFEDMTAVNPDPNNHAIIGTTAIVNNTWYHAAATFDGATFKVYLNGNLEGSVATTAVPRWNSIQHAGLATGLTSTGVAAGFFAGRMDEARIWSVARTQAEIQGSMNSEILVPTPGLAGRWGMNDAVGTATVANLNRLGVTSFTLEAWVKRAGVGGLTMSTGSLGFDGAGGRPNGLYPVLAKGMGEGETPANINTNWILGITANNFVGADFEDTAGGVNRPAWGTTAILPTDTNWHHIAATYTGSCWAMYVDGVPDPLNAIAVACPNATPESTSYQRAALSAGINSTGGLGAGFFYGAIDEARIWNRALSPSEIAANKNLELTSGTGLMARWGMAEGSGTTINSSVGTFPGTVMGSTTWVPGFPMPDTTPPAAPAGLAATPGNTVVNLTWTANSEPDLAGYNVYRYDAPSTYTKANTILLTSPAYAVTSLTNGTPYTFVVTAVDTSTNESTYSSPASATPAGDITPPAAPTGLTAVPLGKTVNLNWTAPADLDVAGYNVYRGTVPGVPLTSPINGGTLVTGITYSDGGRTNGTPYYYVVTAVDTSANQSVASNEANATPLASLGSALAFDGTNNYVTFGAAPGLGVQTFTIETWFNWTGGGTTASTGSGGITAIPLVTKGLHEADGSNVDANYFLGIAGGKLSADFEDVATGANWPVTGTTTVTTNTWHHAAVTYDGQTWKLYLDGVLDTTRTLPAPSLPRSDSIQHAGIGTAMNSTGVTEGRFAGKVDEVRIWNVVRTQSEIMGTINNELTAGSGLIARWGMNEGSGTTIGSSIGSFPGTFSTNGPTWVPGAPFNIAPPAPPAAPTGLSATGGNTVVNLTWTDNSEPDLAGYNVYRYVAPSTYTKVNTSLLTIPAYVVNGLTNGTPYTFVVTAVNTASNESTYSSAATATPFGDITPPATPTGLGATGGPSLINLTWTANGEPDLAGYNLYRSTTHNGPYAKINTPLITGTAYSDTTVTNGTPYYYVLRAVDTSTNESGNSSEVTATPAEAATGLQFASASSQYVTFGAAPGLGVQTFTIETWFKKTGAGVTTSTGTGGLTAVPLVTKGRGEAENTNQDMNYFFGIDSTGVLAADLEECARVQTGCPATVSNLTQGGQNYPAKGSTVIQDNIWYHAAVTFDGRYWKLYLNGVQDGATTDTGENRYPRWDSIQHAGIGTAMTSTGAAAGFFNGVVDEVRIWNVARTPAEIMGTINSQITGPQTGLVARWGMGEGTGTTINSSIGSFPGPLTNGPTFVAGAPFNIAEPTAPAAPTLLSAMPTAGLAIDLAWTDNSSNETSFKIERSPLETGSWTQIGTAAAGAVAYADGGLDPATQYCYRVRASNSIGDSDYSNVSCADTAGTPNNGLYLGASNAYVDVGNPSALGLKTFTLETWFKRTATGATTYTGSGGVVAVPLISKGMAESETANTDVNYFLGIGNIVGNSTNVLVADFEECVQLQTGCQTGGTSSLNHPIVGVTPITADGVWHHAAVTYDGQIWKLYLDGNLETTLNLGTTIYPQFASAQKVALATALNSSGLPGTSGTYGPGYFVGNLDETRIWDIARTQAEIQGTLNSAITSPQTHLVGRWGLDETSGTTVASSAGTAVDGTITGAGSSWGPGAPAIVNHTPAFVSGTPSDGATSVSTSPTLTVNVSDADLDNQTISFYGRPKDGAGADFTLVAIPDPQYYASTYPSIYNAQMDWAVNNKITRNIPYVIGLGDNVDSAASSTQWSNATTAWDKLTTGGIPYGIEAGNHDGAPSGTANFDTNFGGRKTAQTATYGGRYGTSNYDNYYTFFDASGMHFIVVFIEYDDSMTSTSNPVLTWANGILAANSSRRAIVVTHNLLQGGSSNLFSAQGQAVYDALKGNPNLFLMLGGHLDVARRRADTYNSNTVYSLRSDYQFVGGEQSGYLRIMRFSPADNAIHVSTYSPTLHQDYPDETPPQNAFDLPYTMSGSSAFTLIGTDNNVLAGTDASMVWPGLANSTQYEWYAETSDGRLVATSDTRGFTTEAGVTCYALTLSHTGQGNNPVASPANSTGCPAGQYVATESITLSGAAPAAGWQIGSWTGTNDNASTASTNMVTMPASAHTAGVNYTAITYSISLVSGWNLISFNLHPLNADTATVLSSIAGHYDLVYAWDASGAHAANGNWMKYDPVQPFGNTLTSLDETMGIWIHMTSPATLNVVGTVPVTTNIPVLNDVGGWNLVAYPSAVNRALPDVLRDHGVGTDFSLVYANHASDTADPWKLYDPAAPTWANDLTEMSPGWGYWVWVGGDHTWSVGYGAP